MKPIVSASVCLAAWLWVFWPVLFGGQVFWYGDLALYFIPLLHFQRAELLTGHVPLWNPWILCGTPFIGNPQAWPLYPSSGILSVLSEERSVGVLGALHCLWAMLGTGMFLRRRGVGECGQALGALAFGLGGALVSKCQFPNMVQAGSWLPWLLWAIEGALETPRIGKLALCVGLAALSAHPQMTWMQAFLCVAWVAYRKPNRATVGRLALATVLGGLLAAGQLLPTVGAALDSVRPKLSLGEASRFFLPIYMLPTVFVAPNFYGNPVSAPPYIGRGNFWEPCAYGGLASLALAGLSLRGIRLSSETRFWLAVFVVCVWLALGKSGGLYFLAFYGLPGAKTFHDPARFLHLASFALAVMASRGLDGLKARDGAKLGLVCWAAVDLALFARTLNPTISQVRFDAEVSRLATSLSGVGRVWNESERPIWRRFIDYRAIGSDPDPVSVLSSAVPNTPLLVGIRDAGGYEPVRRKDYDGFSDRKRAGVTDALSWNRVSGLVRTKVSGSPRATIDGKAVSIERETADRVELELPTGHPGGALVLRDVAAPGWHAAIDGSEVPIRPSQGVFRAVDVHAGAKRVAFWYAPTLVRIGLFLSLLAGCVLAFLSVVGDNESHVRTFLRR